MSKTPRTDAACFRQPAFDRDFVEADFARQLERELYWANECVNAVAMEIRRLKLLVNDKQVHNPSSEEMLLAHKLQFGEQ